MCSRKIETRRIDPVLPTLKSESALSVPLRPQKTGRVGSKLITIRSKDSNRPSKLLDTSQYDPKSFLVDFEKAVRVQSDSMNLPVLKIPASLRSGSRGRGLPSMGLIPLGSGRNGSREVAPLMSLAPIVPKKIGHDFFESVFGSQIRVVAKPLEKSSHPAPVAVLPPVETKKSEKRLVVSKRREGKSRKPPGTLSTNRYDPVPRPEAVVDSLVTSQPLPVAPNAFQLKDLDKVRQFFEQENTGWSFQASRQTPLEVLGRLHQAKKVFTFSNVAAPPPIISDALEGDLK